MTEWKPVAHCEVGHVKGDSGNQCWDPVHAALPLSNGSVLFICEKHAKVSGEVKQ